MRKLIALTALLILISIPAFATLPATTAWQVFPSTGASTNGGGYVYGTAATTTDYSLFINKNAAGCSSCGSSTVDLSTTDAVAVGTTSITSATANFSAAKGNIAYFTGGTGSIAAVRRQIVSVTNSTTIVLDTAIAASTGMTMNIGGALDTITTALTANTTYNVICVLNNGNTATTNAGYTLNNSVSPADSFNRLWGYTTTCGDHLGGTLQLITNTGLTLINGTNIDGWWIDGLTLDCNALGTSTGFTIRNQALITNSVIKNCQTKLFSTTGNYINLDNVEMTGFTTGATAITFAPATMAHRLYVHDNAATSLVLDMGASSSIIDSIFDTNTGASTDCVRFDLNQTIDNNVFFKCGRDAIQDTGSAGHFLLGTFVRNNIFEANGRYGLNCSTGGTIASTPASDWNAYYNNGTAATFNCDSTVSGTPYTYIGNQTLTGSPFIDADNQNFNLNNTSGAGAAIRGTASPGTIKGATGTGYMTFGPIQPQYGQASSAGGGNIGMVH